MFCPNAHNAVPLKFDLHPLKLKMSAVELKPSVLLYIYKTKHTTVHTNAYYLVV